MSLLEQIKRRRVQLGLKQHDMVLRMGMSRQQYQRLESKGNPRLDTLELIAKGLNSELMLIPRNRIAAVKVMLSGEGPSRTEAQGLDSPKATDSGDPWKDLL